VFKECRLKEQKNQMVSLLFNPEDTMSMISGKEFQIQNLPDHKTILDLK